MLPKIRVVRSFGGVVELAKWTIRCCKIQSLSYTVLKSSILTEVEVVADVPLCTRIDDDMFESAVLRNPVRLI